MSRAPEPRRPPGIRSVERPGGGRRLIVELGSRDERAYRLAVGRLTPRIERSLGPGVFANRSLGRGRPAAARLEPWLPGWRRWIRRLRATRDGPVVRADVASFYGSVGEPALMQSLGPGAEDVLRVLRTLWNDGVSGLPIGPEPSAILANAVLAPVDRALRDAGFEPLRWVDDWVVAVPGAGAAGRGLVVLEQALGELGLELNPTKTGVLSAEEARVLLGPGGHAVPASGRAMMLAREDPLPRVPRTNARLPADRGVGAGRRTPRRAGRLG